MNTTTNATGANGLGATFSDIVFRGHPKVEGRRYAPANAENDYENQ